MVTLLADFVAFVRTSNDAEPNRQARIHFSHGAARIERKSNERDRRPGVSRRAACVSRAG